MPCVRAHSITIFAGGDSDLVEITPELKELLDAWGPLTQEQRKTVLQVAKSYHKK